MKLRFRAERSVPATRICPGKHCTAARAAEVTGQSLNLEIYLGALRVGSRFVSSTSRVRPVDVEAAPRTSAVPPHAERSPQRSPPKNKSAHSNLSSLEGLVTERRSPRRSPPRDNHCRHLPVLFLMESAPLLASQTLTQRGAPHIWLVPQFCPAGLGLGLTLSW